MTPGSRTPQARAWLDAGRRVEQIDLYDGAVTFVNETDE